MTSERRPSPSRPFIGDEVGRLAAYLKSACVDPSDCDHLGLPGNEFNELVDRFIAVLNKRSLDYGLARVAVRKLWETKALPKCQMAAMFVYAQLCANGSNEHTKAKLYLERRLASADQIQPTLTQIGKLRKALEDEDRTAAELYAFPKLNDDAILITSLMSGCVQGIQEIQKIHRDSYNLHRTNRALALLRRMARDQLLECPHPQDAKARASDIEQMLTPIHEALTGRPPDHKTAALYLEVNMTRDALRQAEEKNIAKLQELIDGFNEIVPDFLERICDQNLEELEKTPRQVQVPSDLEEILLLASVHLAFTKSACNSLVIELLRGANELAAQTMRGGKPE